VENLTMAKRRGKTAIVRRLTLKTGTPAPAAAQDDELLPNDEAAAFLRISPDTLLTWRCRHRGPAYYKVGRFAYYRLADLKAWLEKQRREPKAA
jgi:hypothetical protein